MNIFKEKELLEPTFFQRLFGKKQKQNALIEINNLLAANQTNLKNISFENILEIAEKYNTDIKKQDYQFRIDLFEIYLDYCLSDKKIEGNEILDLEHLKLILLLNDSDTHLVVKKAAEKIFSQMVNETLENGEMDLLKKENIHKLKTDLLIPENIAQSIFQKSAMELYQKLIDIAVSDERLSPEEETELERIARGLGIDQEYLDNKKDTLNRFKLYWQIENGTLPILNPDIVMQKSETLHFRTNVNWLEQRKITKRINYGGPVARIKIAKGIYYRVGSVDIQRVSEDIWQTIDAGVIYLTNKRLIFMGGKGNKTIPINKILDLKPYKNGVSIQKDSGKSPFLEFEENIDIFSMILVRFMN